MKEEFIRKTLSEYFINLRNIHLIKIDENYNIIEVEDLGIKMSNYSIKYQTMKNISEIENSR